MTKEQSSDMIEKEARKEETGVPPVSIAKASLTYEGPLPPPMILAGVAKALSINKKK